jgi:hypothetical protein
MYNAYIIFVKDIKASYIKKINGVKFTICIKWIKPLLGSLCYGLEFFANKGLLGV